MTYVDGCVLAVPNENKQAYIDHEQASAPLFKKYGALRVVVAWGHDVPDGEVTSFPKAVQCKDDESVVYTWITWPSKEARDEGWGRMMEDPYFSEDGPKPPFDGKRMIFGGFETVVDV